MTENIQIQTPEEMFETLRQGFAARLDGKLLELQVSADSIVANGPRDDVRTALVSLRDQAHRLAGSAGTFGFSELGSAAKTLELYCQPLADGNEPPSASDCRAIDALVRALEVSDTKSESHDDLLTNIDFADQTAVRKLTGHPTILLIESQRDQTRRLKIGLGTFGYDIEVVSKSENIQQAIETLDPVAIMLDLESEGPQLQGAEIIQHIRSVPGPARPLIVMTSEGSFNSRLTSVRAGCDHFLTKPATLNEIVEVLDANTLPGEKEPERVLIIDDDPDILEIVTGTLQSASMIVESLSDPSLALGTIETFHPEIILLDLHMSECNGRELAAIIRQIPENMALPIVFLSAETDKDAQQDAMGTSADEFLTKPIHPRHLINSVRSRAERFRGLRDMMRRDSLTGLYNHGTIWQLFEVELSRSKRSGEGFSFAMLDIDHFKAVNDTYGHAVGDTVLRALSSVLKHRLRHGDIIGRLGGEEFGVILPATSIDQARSVVETIRQSFAEISPGAAGSQNPITLSCGLVGSTDYNSMSEMAEAADRALYGAKTSGRDKTVLAGMATHSSSSGPASATEQSAAGISPQAVPVPRIAPTPTDSSTEGETARPLKDAIVIDDDPLSGEFIKPFARDAGFQIETVTDPTAFAATYRAGTELIILDLNMPDMDGIEMLRFLGDNRSEAAIIIISGYDQEILSAARNLARKQNLNFIDALQKPVAPVDLMRVLEAAYSTTGNNDRHYSKEGSEELPSVRELGDAIATGKLEIYFQPKVRLPDRSIVGAEALARWHHPEKGFIPPDYFVPVAEQHSLIDGLTVFVLEETCKYLKRYRDDGLAIKISVNISDRSFDDLSFPEQISDIVSAADLSSSDLILEFTETSLSSDDIHVADILTRLRLKGFEISIDDFGTGHSSLSRLNKMPFSELKIDKSFVGEMHNNAASRAIVKNTVDLAKSLGMKIVAEGAEELAHLEILEEFGCDLVQGYYISRPMPPAEFESWFRENQVIPA